MGCGDKKYSFVEQKAGDSFEATYGLPLDVGGAVASIRCQVRFKDVLVQELTVEQQDDTDTQSVWIISATPEETALWPIKLLDLDVQHTFVDGKIVSTKDINIPMVKGVTHD